MEKQDYEKIALTWMKASGVDEQHVLHYHACNVGGARLLIADECFLMYDFIIDVDGSILRVGVWHWEGERKV